jgi:hypothetical protein
MTPFRIAIVAVAFVVAQLRRVPGAGIVGRYRGQIVAALSVLAAVAFIVWGLERAPQRFTLAQLAAGELSPLQSWIIVSGELTADSAQPPRYLYRLRDPQAPNASVIVVAGFELPLGWQTISGQWTGTREGVPAGFPWVGYMEAEPVVAQEQPPPWVAIGLAGLALLLVGGGRTSYPMFFRETPGRAQHPSRSLPVSVRERWPEPGEADNGTLVFSPDGPVQLQSPGREQVELRLHSAHTSADVGELRSLDRAEPALLLRRATGELLLAFASRADRDAVFSALVADAQRDIPGVGR